MATVLETINLEIQMEDRSEEHRGEKGVDALFALRNNLNTIQGVFKKRKINSICQRYAYRTITWNVVISVRFVIRR